MLKTNYRLLIALVALCAVSPVVFFADEQVPAAAGGESAEWRASVPRTWDEDALHTSQVPLAVPEYSPVHVSSEFYYQMTMRTIYKSYPIYHPDKEPKGYWEQLQQMEPEVAFDPAGLETKQDWIAAGEVVFNAPISFRGVTPAQKVRDASWWEEFDIPMAEDGTLAFNRYFVLEKGKVLVGEFSCATCHTRVMSDGTVVRGAQGNLPLALLDARGKEQAFTRFKEEDKPKMMKQIRASIESVFGVPWLDPNPLAPMFELSLEQRTQLESSIPPGVQSRFATSPLYPVQVSDLIGVEERKYLDHTGHFRHRSIGDLMRYAALNQGLERLDRYGEYTVGRPVPDKPSSRARRYSDEQLYALALYIYSLEPPENPNPYDELAKRGEKIFHREECNECHVPPLYTSNKLTPATGYIIPEDHPDLANLKRRSVGTDPSLALKTRRGTGFYKVPSLKGVWYRGPFGHGGWAATLEDWFDPDRLHDDYVATGFRGYKGPQAVDGHRFGLNLPAADVKALIAFLKTL